LQVSDTAKGKQWGGMHMKQNSQPPERMACEIG